jgi:hypothetical protein
MQEYIEKEAVVYWIHKQDHTNPFDEGYIGVTTNFNHRMESHKRTPVNNHMANAIAKYGWENLVVDVLHSGLESECYPIENSYRNTKLIGWNICIGGEQPLGGSTGYKKSEEQIKTLRENALIQHKNNPELAKQLSQYNADTKSKTYLITHPSGYTEVITNMRKFCREMDLSQSAMTQVAKGKRSDYKGYKAKVH